MKKADCTKIELISQEGHTTTDNVLILFIVFLLINLSIIVFSCITLGTCSDCLVVKI